MLEGLRPSVGTVRDALDDALCETTIGLYRPMSPRGFPVPGRADPHPHRPGEHHVSVGELVQRRG